MEAYIDYNFYKNRYKGSTIPEAAFDEIALRATAYIDYLTFNQIKIATDDIKMATCAAAEAGYKFSLKEDISSERVGKVSVTYGGRRRMTAEKKMKEAATVYLTKTGLLSRQIPVRGWF